MNYRSDRNKSITSKELSAVFALASMLGIFIIVAVLVIGNWLCDGVIY